METVWRGSKSVIINKVQGKLTGVVHGAPPFPGSTDQEMGNPPGCNSLVETNKDI